MTVPKMLTASDVREMLRRECEKAGNQSEWARQHGMTRQYLSLVLCGGTPPYSPLITKPLGLVFIPQWRLDNGGEHA